LSDATFPSVPVVMLSRVGTKSCVTMVSGVTMRVPAGNVARSMLLAGVPISA